MQSEVNWKHWVGVGALVVLIGFGVWNLMNRPGERPNAAVPAGPNARMQDAPAQEPGTQPGQALGPDGAPLPTIR